MPKVLISDKLSPAAVQIFLDRGIEADVRTGLRPEELKAIIADYDGLAIRSATKVSADILAAATKLKVVGRAGIGVDNIDLAAATQRGVVVMNTPFGNSITTAEHAIALMFSLARQIPQANALTHAGQWEKNRFLGTELTGKTLGVVGCGNIGAIVCDRALGLKMRVVAYDPFLSFERAADLGVEKVDLDELFARADFITLHTPLTDATRDLINAKSIAKMKKGVRIINCARGGLVVEADLKAAIESGHVAGVALDVFKNEPPVGNPLFGMEQVVCTPHLGASTSEAQENVALQIAEQMVDYLLTGAVTNALNMPSVSAEDAPKLRPYMSLAKQLGSFAGQLTEHALKSVRIDFQGHVAELNTKPLTAILLQGLLSPLLENVNMVNAPLVARERDIDITESTNEQVSDYQTLIRLTVTTDVRKRSVAGTLFGGDKPRIVEIKDIPIEAELGPYMLYVSNTDKPGFIGNLGSTLGAEGINIATFHLGRNAAGGDAIALIQVDQPISDSLLEKVRAIPNVLQAKALRF
ncbi:phosphoglycerate dehydrogenase [Telmatospirillum sp. J64-1]|uniref:phosphoglycerate dehydrogenase n=1 Tax=Telmatospirillum sp. J64-1 TaxID=2502183 RepID=UPI00115DAF45|nr:phosphoglycerate dehydrogenase [Telmatospirillum sp. J64-1]